MIRVESILTSLPNYNMSTNQTCMHDNHNVDMFLKGHLTHLSSSTSSLVFMFYPYRTHAMVEELIVHGSMMSILRGHGLWGVSTTDGRIRNIIHPKMEREYNKRKGRISISYHVSILFFNFSKKLYYVKLYIDTK